MKKLFILFSILACSLSAIAQVNTFGGIGLRVNDTTTYQTNAAAYHTAGYYDIYFNNQATNDHFDVWNGSSYDHIFSFNAGGVGGVTSVSGTSNRITSTGGTTPVIDISASYVGQSSITTLGTLTTGTTGTGFTLSFTNSTLSGRIAEANIPAMYVEDQATTVTTGGTITLDCNSQKKRVHLGSATFATPKTIALSNTTNARQFFFLFQITNVAAVLTMPSDFLLNDPNWDESANTWTPTDVGRYILAGYFDGTNWWVNISGAPYN